MFTVDLPVAAGDSAFAAYGIWPFGVHGSSHAFDGHPGFDVEFVPGTSVRAASDGVIANLQPDTNVAGRFTLRISHNAGGQSYATDYTNIDSLAPGITVGAAVSRGQPLGMAGVQTQLIGSSLVTWAMTHFQVNDFSQNAGLTNPNAVSPEAWLSQTGRDLLGQLWLNAAYAAELTEPFVTNNRNASFPLTRTWTASGGSISRIDFTRADPLSNSHSYSFWTGGVLVDSGTVTTVPHGALSFVDFNSQTGITRLGVYDIVNAVMRLNLSAPGVSRPQSLAGAVVYSTQ